MSNIFMSLSFALFNTKIFNFFHIKWLWAEGGDKEGIFFIGLSRTGWRGRETRACLSVALGLQQHFSANFIGMHFLLN